MARMPGKKLIKIPTEDHEQIMLATWLAKERIRFYAIPNGGKRNLKEAVKFKRMGTISGVPDICIPIPSGRYNGLYLELKRIAGGRVSESQEEWLDFLNKNGYIARVAHGFLEAKAIVINYFALNEPVA